MNHVAELSPEALFDLDEIEAFPAFDAPDFMPDAPTIAFTFAEAATFDTALCTYAITIANENPYDGVFCFAQSPFGLVAWGQVGRGALGVVVNSVGIAAGAVFSETGAGLVVMGYCSYGVGSSFGNMINGFRDAPAGPTGPASALSQGAMLTAGVNPNSSAYRYVDYGAQATDLAVPLIASGGLDWRLVTRPAGLPGTLPGAVTRVLEDPQAASLAARLAVGTDAAITAGEGIGNAIGETKKKKCP